MARPTNKQADVHFGQLNQFQLLNEDEAATLLNIKVATLRRWRRAGKPPQFVKIGSSVRHPSTEAVGLRTDHSAIIAQNRNAE